MDLHRYPDPNNLELKQLFCDYRNVTNPNMVFLGVGSDEVIDLLFRITCVPAKDKVLICPPTYGMYAVCAKLNDVPVVKIPLDCEDAKFTIQIDLVSQNEL